jgi:tRNA G18 (ribose-2'-O)-methylase SpoU
MRKLLNEELNRLEIDEFKLARKIPVVVVLDNVRSMNNIGSVFRTSDAFLIEKIYLCGITAKPPHKDIHKTALGATDSVEWDYFEDTNRVLDELKVRGYHLIAVEQAEGSSKLGGRIFKKDEKIAVVFGHEVRGVQQSVVDYCDEVLEIPQFGTKHSLNISVCAGVVLWEIAKNYY